MPRRVKAHDPTSKTVHKASEVVTRQLAHPRVWQTAMRVAENRRESIEINTFTKITVTLH